MQTFSEWLTARGMVEADLDAAALTEQRAEYDREVAASTDPATPPADPPPADPATNRTDPTPPPASDPIAGEAIARRVLADERTRAAAIRSEGEGVDAPAALITRLIDDGTALDGARQAFLTHVRESRAGSTGAPNIHVRSASDLTGEVLEAALSLRANLPVAAAALNRSNRRTHVDPDMAERADRFSDLSLLDMCREACRIEGIDVPHRRHDQIRAAVSTAALANILENVQNKAMMSGFLAAPNTARLWCQLRDVADFKPNSRVRKSDAEKLKKVNDAGEVEYGSLSDIKESYQVDQFAELIVFTEKDIRNDDLGALDDTPRDLGQSAADLESDLVYSNLLSNPNLNQDGTAVFTAGHGNLETGAGSALSATTLALLIEKLGLQTDINGRALNILPVHFLYPNQLWFLARQLVRSTEVRTSGDTDVANAGTHNPLSEVGLNPIQEPRLSTGALGQAGTATQFYVFGGRSTYELGFLTGTGRAPRIERVALNANQLGLGTRVVHAVGTMPLEFRAMQKSDGA